MEETVLSISPENIATVTLMALAGFLVFSFIAAMLRREVGA